MGMQAPAAAGRESSAPRPYIGYITSQWHTRQPQSLEQLAAISWCRSHAERMAGAALINHGGTVIYQHVRVARPPSPSCLQSAPAPSRPRLSREKRSTERRTGALRGKSIPELPPPRALPSLSATHRRWPGGSYSRKPAGGRGRRGSSSRSQRAGPHATGAGASGG